jgi:hypothetical protein
MLISLSTTKTKGRHRKGRHRISINIWLPEFFLILFFGCLGKPNKNPGNLNQNFYYFFVFGCPGILFKFPEFLFGLPYFLIFPGFVKKKQKKVFVWIF